jgi:acetyl-CoA C-acetyltransferase
LTADHGLIYDEVVTKIKLKNAHMTTVGRHRESYFDLLGAAIAPLLSNADPQRIARIYYSSFAPMELCRIENPRRELRAFLREHYPAVTAPIHGPFRTGGEALYRALTDGVSASGDTLLVGCEKMTHMPAGRAAGLLAPRVSGPVEQRHGATLPALAALATQSYMASFRVPYHAFHHVARKNHYHGSLNPDAHFQTPVTIDEVAQSPLVADPLRRHHSAPMSDGAAACLLSRDGEGIAMRGWARGLDVPLFHERRDPGRFPAAARAAREALAMSGRACADVDVVEIHDAFSPFELMNLEEMGFFAPGPSWHALENGELHVGGRLAVNPSGGMKARGHPIGVCGLSSIVEMHAQITGTAGERQQRGARCGMVQSAGGVSRDTYAFVLEAP